MSLTIKQHDTKPDLVIGVTDDEATFEQVQSWRILIKRGADLIFQGAPDVIAADDSGNPHTATLTHKWLSTETDTASYPGMNVEAEATWPDGSIQSFPPSGFLVVVVTPDLG